MFNGLPDRGKSNALDETHEAFKEDERIRRLKQQGIELPIQTIKIEQGIARAKPQDPEDLTQRLAYKSGNYECSDYQAGSIEFTNMLAQSLERPGIILGETVGLVGYKEPNSSVVTGWDIGCSTTCDLVRRKPPFGNNYIVSIVALDADELVIARGKLQRNHRVIGDLHEIQPTLGLYSRGEGLGGGVLDSVIKIEQLFQDTVRTAVYNDLIDKSLHNDQKTREFFFRYFKKLLKMPKTRLFMGYNYWLGKPLTEDVDNDDAA